MSEIPSVNNNQTPSTGPGPENTTDAYNNNSLIRDSVVPSTETADKEMTGALSPNPADSSLHGMTDSAIKSAKSYLPESIGSYLPSSPNAPIKGVSNVTGPDPTGASKNATGILGGYIPNVGQTAKQYVPQSVASYLPGSGKQTSLPTTEIPSGSAGGVGSLPGTISEASVAKLPEERRQEGLPSHETDHEKLGKTGGVGPLPGGPNESGVALLPEERAHGADEILKTPSAGVLGSNASSKATPGTQIGSSPLSKPPQVATQPPGLGVTDLGKADTGERTSPAANAQSNTQKSREGAQEIKGKVAGALHDKKGETPASNGSAATSRPANENAGATTTTSAPGGKDSGHRASTGSAGTPHKVGFMDKLKGEAMVISGKLGKNEKKVEEGRHLMGK